MSERDDLWREIASLEGVWDGSIVPDDAPVWCTRFATLVEAANGPATADELATEAEVVAAMQCLLRSASDPTGLDPDLELDLAFGPDVGMVPDHGRAARSPGVGRLVAAKIVAVVAVVVLGATAAAATAGVVVPLLSSPKADPHPRVDVTTTVPGGTKSDDGTTGPAGTSDGRRDEDGDGSDATTTDETGTEATTPPTSPTGSGNANGNANVTANGAGTNHGNSTSNSTSTTTTSTTTTPPDPNPSPGHGPPPPNEHGKKKGLSDAPGQNGTAAPPEDPPADVSTNYAI